MQLLIFGDSICAGSNIPGGSAEDGWISHLARQRPWTVLNRSKGGRPTDSLDAFAEALVGVEPGACLVIALGANDARSLAADMVQQAVGNLRAMVARARAAGVTRILLFGPTNIRKESLQASYGIRHERDRNLQALNTAYRELAQELGVGFHSLYGLVPEDSMTADGVHPDRAGNLALAQALQSVLDDFVDGTTASTRA